MMKKKRIFSSIVLFFLSIFFVSCSNKNVLTNCKNIMVDKTLTNYSESYDDFNQSNLDGYLYVAPYIKLSKLDDASLIIKNKDNFTYQSNSFPYYDLYKLYIKDGKVKDDLISIIKKIEKYSSLIIEQEEKTKNKDNYYVDIVLGEFSTCSTVLNISDKIKLQDNAENFLFSSLFQSKDDVSAIEYISFLTTIRKILEDDNIVVIRRSISYLNYGENDNSNTTNATFTLNESYIIEEEKTKMISSLVESTNENAYIYGFNQISINNNSLILLNGSK